MPPTDHRSPSKLTARDSALPIRGWVAAWLLFGWVVNLSWPHLSVSLSLEALAPLAAAWAVHRFGPHVVAPLAALPLVPSFNVAFNPSLSLGVAPIPLSFMLAGIAAGALLAAQRDAEPWLGLVHRSRAWLIAPAFAIVLLGYFEWPRYSPRGLNISVYPTFDLAGGIAALLLVLVVDWRTLASHAVGEGGPRATRALVRWALPALLVGAASISLGVPVKTLYFGWGSGSSFGLAPALCLLGVVGSRRWLAIVAALVAVEALRLYAGLPPLALFLETSFPSRPFDAEIWSAACDLASAMLAAFVLTSVLAPGGVAPSLSSRRGDALARVWLAMAAIVLLQFVVRPLADHVVEFWARGAIAWLVGVIAFAAASLRGGRAVVAAPLALAASAVAVPMIVEGVERPLRLLDDALGVAAVAAMYAFIGMLVRRSLESAPEAQLSAAAQLDVGRLANFVRRLDTSATLRSFGALLVVVGVGLALVELGVTALIVQSFATPDLIDGSELALAWLLVLVVLLAPLAFIAIDAMNRKDGLRPLSALSGAALAAVVVAFGVVLVGILVGAMIDNLDDSGWARASGAILVAALFIVVLLARSRRTLVTAWAVLLLLLAAGVAIVVPAAIADARLSPSYAALAVGLLVVTVVLALLVRGVLLRADLAGDIPRGLLFGEIEGGGFWARLALLMGMPASMWNRAALRTPAFWAMLLARPAVYAGALGVWRSSVFIGVVAIVAGHGLFEGGKRLAARTIWRVGERAGDAPVLFLRSFADDQFDLGGRSRNPLRRWLELWAFRRNLDEALIDEVARYGPVVALGRPGETSAPFGAARHYATHADWQRIITDTARRAHTIVVVAGDTPGVRWEYDLLAREHLLERTVLLFRPGAESRAANRAALAAFPLNESERAGLGDPGAAPFVALLHLKGKPVLLNASSPEPAAYVLTLRAHFQRRDVAALAQAARSAPPDRGRLGALLTAG